MKTKICLCLLLMMAFCSCEKNQLGQTPETDTTLLWPAPDSTGLWGYINEKGEMVIPAKYFHTFGFSCGRAMVLQESVSDMAFIDKNGSILLTRNYDEDYDTYFYYGCCRVYKVLPTSLGLGSPPIAMIDDNFNILFQADSYYRFMNPMTKDGLVLTDLGYLNKKGEIIFPKENIRLNDVSCFDFCDGVAVLAPSWKRKDGQIYPQYGAINTKGEYVIDSIYYLLQSVGCNRLLYHTEVQKAGEAPLLVGLMDTQGNIITEPFIEGGYSMFFGDGDLLPARDYYQGKWGYIDKNGTWQFPAQYDRAYPFYEGVAWVLNREDGWKLIDLKGNVVLALDDVNKSPNGMFHNGLCLIWDSPNRQNMYINKQGEVIYSWTAKSAKKQSNSLEKTDPSSFDYDEMLLRLFEGTNYYPLAEQSLRTRKLNN